LGGPRSPGRQLRALIACAAVVLSAPASGALAGVTEFRQTPEALTDAELSALLHAAVAPAQVVAIGESVHGSAGLLRIQGRIIRYLVEVHGHRLLVWENPTLRSLELSRWLAACVHARTPPPLDVLYMPTRADRAWLDWLCAFNHARPQDPVVFRGMDVWDRPWEHYANIQALGAAAGVGPALQAIVRTTCPAHAATSWRAVDARLAQLLGGGVFQPRAAFEKCSAALSALVGAARQAALERRRAGSAGADEAFELAISASTVLGWLEFQDRAGSDDILSWNGRDRAQGRNLRLLMDKHGASRAIVAAHTSHVSHGRSATDWWGYGDFKSGIHFYSLQQPQDRVFTIALTAYQASGTQGEWLLPTAANSVDRKLHAAGHRFAFFPAGAGFLSEHRTWWMQNGNAPGPQENGVEIVPGDHFDAYFFLNQSLLDEALPQRPIWQP
jgi:erythromycin esterase-like protein